MDLRQQSAVGNGFGDGLQQAFELVVTPAVFGFFGFLLDRWLGTTLIFTLLFTSVVLAYMVWKLVTGYAADMDRAEEGKPWTRSRAQVEEGTHG